MINLIPGLLGKDNITLRLFRNAFWLFGGKSASGMLSAVQTIVLARYLGASDYGLLVLVIAFVDILNNFFDWRMWETATKYIGTYWTKGDKQKTSSMIKLSYVVDILTGIVAFLVAILAAKVATTYFIKVPGAEPKIYIYSFSLLISTANATSEAILRVFNRFKLIAFVTSSTYLTRLALITVAVLLNMGVNAVLFCYVGAAFFGFIARAGLVLKTLSDNGLGAWWGARLSLLKHEWKEIAWFLGNTSFAGTLKMANDDYLASLSLGYFANKEAAAYYRVAKSVTKIMVRLIDPIYEAIYPEFVRTVTNKALANLKTMILESTKSLGAILVPLSIAFVVFADLIVEIVFGGEYKGASSALRIVSIAVLLNQMTFWINPAFLAFGKPGLRTYVAVVSTLLYVLFLLLLVPKYSYLGAAFSFLGYAIVRVLVSMVAIKKSYREQERSILLNE